ncbi:MAG: diacylglycerol kinase family lipid kinase [Hyphomicrobiales bacterium]|nr:diacylglycerol kinase family lipid kinase [Hyphomicrobiales bacterium]
MTVPSDPQVERLLVIHNPTAGRRRGRFLHDVLADLRGRGIAVTLRPTTGPGDARRLARDADTAAFDAVAVAGGDGTINEAINGLVARPDRHRLPMALIPMGTANVLAAEIGLECRAADVAAAIAGGRRRRIHLGRANGRLFVMMAGVGFDAHVVATVSPRLKRALGKAAFVWQSLVAMARFPFPTYGVVIDGQRHDAASAVIANGHFYGGRFTCAPAARLDDGLLHVCLFTRPGAWSAFQYAAALVLGRLDRMSSVRVVPARAVEIAGPDRDPVQGDGEIVGHLGLKVAVAEETLDLIVP